MCIHLHTISEYVMDRQTDRCVKTISRSACTECRHVIKSAMGLVDIKLTRKFTGTATADQHLECKNQ